MGIEVDSFGIDVHKEVAAVAPINGVSIGRKDAKETWRIDFAPEATPAQRRAAQDVVDGFDTNRRGPPDEVRELQVRVAALEARVTALEEAP